jgi:hypothetical protein
MFGKINAYWKAIREICLKFSTSYLAEWLSRCSKEKQDESL